MPINAYVGLQGHGKTYEVVEAVVVPAIAKGRRIVTNIDGFNIEAIEQFILETTKEIVKGDVVVIGNDALASNKFLYDGVSEDTIVKPGDLVIVDEAWRVWGEDSKIPDSHMIFFREHRHFSNAETGFTSDLVVIVQSIGDLHRKLRRVVERTFEMTKVKELGLDNFYVVNQYGGSILRRTKLINTWRKKYDPKIFALYKSYSRGQAQETAVDRRQNLLADPRLWRTVILLIVLCAAGGYFLYRFFSGAHLKKPPTLDKPAADAPAAPRRSDTQKIAGARSEQIQAGPALSDQWQLIGYMIREHTVVVVMRADDGRYRYTYNLPDVRMQGIDVSANLDGQGVAPWTGKRPGMSSAAKGVFK